MKRFTAKLGAIIVIVMIFVAIFGSYIAPHDPNQYHLDKSFAAPSLEYPLGNDSEGRDILSRLIYGARISIGIGIAVVSVSLVIGCFIGMFAGYMGGWIDKIFIFISDVFLPFQDFYLPLP